MPEGDGLWVHPPRPKSLYTTIVGRSWRSGRILSAKSVFRIFYIAFLETAIRLCPTPFHRRTGRRETGSRQAGGFLVEACRNVVGIDRYRELSSWKEAMASPGMCEDPPAEDQQREGRDGVERGQASKESVSAFSQ